MAEILPFIGMRYNSQLIGNLSKVLAPPYDIISPELQDELHQRHPNNVVRMELGRDERDDDGFSNKYTRAANTLGTWRSDGILIEDERPSFYLYEQQFKTADGQVKKRRGFFALVKLEDYKSGAIRAHETTMSGPKVDRLKLLRATHANFSPVFVLYNDPNEEVLKLLSQRMSEKPWEEVVDDDTVTHRLWVVQKKDFLIELRELLKSRQLFIADGHHRYETALKYRDEMREETGKKDGKQPFDYMMMFLTSAEQDGLVILPTHRALTRSFLNQVDMREAVEELKENFDLAKDKVDLEKPEAEAKRLLDKLQTAGKKSHSFAMVLGDGTVFFVTLKKGVNPTEMIDEEDIDDRVKNIDVAILHYYIINYVMAGNPEFELDDDECYYIRDAMRVLELLKQKKAALGFLLNASPLEEVMRIVSAGIRMPHKSTYFHPKIITGLVIRNMECEQKKAAKR
ncbi:MAG: DUF1015 domain-containing protein [Candidatus Sumerlaeaceae bacterium]